MAPPEFTFDEWLTKLAGVAGAFVSMNFIRGSLPAKLMMAVGGFLTSVYWSSWLAQKVGLPEGGCGFFLGLFGMTVISRIWEWAQTWQPGDLWELFMDWLRRLLGLKKKDGGNE